MKKYLLASAIGLMMCLCGCTKFEPAILDLSVTPIQAGSSTLLLNSESKITNNGGCKFINEMGFLYSLNPELTYMADGVTTVIVAKNLETTEFHENFNVPSEMLDTICYVRAYVCTNAGTGYSEPKVVSTHLSE